MAGILRERRFFTVTLRDGDVDRQVEDFIKMEDFSFNFFGVIY